MLQSSSEESDQPVLFVEAAPDPTPAPASLCTGPSHSPRPKPSATALPEQATAGSSDGSVTPSGVQQGSGGPPPGMLLRDWIRQQKKSAAAGANAFPSVQVFCPGGSCALDATVPIVAEAAPRPQPEVEDNGSSPQEIASSEDGEFARASEDARQAAGGGGSMQPYHQGHRWD